MTGRNKEVKKESVEELKEKVRRNSQPSSGSNIQDVLYGPRTENSKAQGVGEYDQ